MGAVKTGVATGHEHLINALSYANELTAVPLDVRRELAEIVTRLGVLGKEVERMR